MKTRWFQEKMFKNALISSWLTEKAEVYLSQLYFVIFYWAHELWLSDCVFILIENVSELSTIHVDIN